MAWAPVKALVTEMHQGTPSMAQYNSRRAAGLLIEKGKGAVLVFDINTHGYSVA
jgi:hypothetical protein